MKCDKSTKRNLLVSWGMRNVGELGLEKTEATIKNMMRKTIPEVREFLKLTYR